MQWVTPDREVREGLGAFHASVVNGSVSVSFFGGRKCFIMSPETLRRDTNPREGHLVAFPGQEGGVQKCRIPAGL